jgi:8-oxo-dGTP pyrophosphatase MutT (NUDIX family)
MTSPPQIPVTPRPAATLLLLRDGVAGLEVLMIERHGKSSFGSGATVFPGGRVDTADHALARFCPPSPDQQQLLSKIAAIRETYEESGVLLGRRAGGGLLSAVDLAEFRRRHDELASFAGAVTAMELELATDLLHPVAHWITPEAEPKRFDTHFFAALAPAEQVAQEDGHEAVEAVWLAPQATIDASVEGKRYLMLPTYLILRQFAAYADARSALAEASRQRIETVMPVFEAVGDGFVIHLPPAMGYDKLDIPERYTRR